MKSQIPASPAGRSNLKSQKIVSEFSSGGVVYQAPSVRLFEPEGSAEPERPEDSAPSTVKSSGLNNPRGTRHQQPTLWLICKHSGYHKWVLPKGIVEDEESPEEAAVREVREETGVIARIIKKIEPDIRYAYSKNGILVHKRVEFFLMEYESGDIADRNWEMEDTKWVSSETALKTLAFVNEQNVLKRALETIR